MQSAALESLKETIGVATRPVVAVVGSGPSTAAGLPSWAALKARLLDVLREKYPPGDATAATERSFEVDNISRTPMWDSFEELRRQLGRATYQDEIARLFTGSDEVKPPNVYSTLWGLPIKGVITLNLDTLLERSHGLVHPGSELKCLVGSKDFRLLGLLQGHHRFLWHLHGVHHDPDSWVFTRDDLQGVVSDARYEGFYVSLLTQHTVIFIGVSLDDVALTIPFQKMISKGIVLAPHYWITDRTDIAAERLAESLGVRIVPYVASDGTHRELEALLAGLKGVQSVDVKAPPVVMDPGAAGPLPGPEELVRQSTEEIRLLLNTEASRRYSDGGEPAFRDLLEEYDEAAHRAWYTSALVGKNTLFGHTLHEQVAKGAFGRVYRATDPAGEDVAVKVLLTEIRTDFDLLESFRRGVKAMYLLQGSAIDGIVHYRTATEIPAVVVMEWVEGPTIKEARDAQQLSEWSDVLWVAREIVRIIRNAHNSKHNILHRDIRPANVMIRDGWLDRDRWQVVVLDFDLSTFRGARQNSVLAESSALGYLAPEQLDGTLGVSTRNALVDSFGIGMTLYFLCGGEEPEAYIYRARDYSARIVQATRRLPETVVASLPFRMARIIVGATHEVQADRWALGEIQGELDQLSYALEGRFEKCSLDFLAGEILARIPSVLDRTKVDNGEERFTFHGATGIDVVILAPRVGDVMELNLQWAATGVEDRGDVAKYLPARMAQAAADLRRGPWVGVTDRADRGSLEIRARLRRGDLLGNIDSAASSLSDALQRLSFA